jgi:replicative DNA helicase
MIIGLVQLNRNNEDVKIGGYKGYPTLANIKECGDYEQDADAVVLVYRPYYYHRNDVNPPEFGDDEKYCRIIVAKNRSGPVGDEECHWDGATGTVVSRLKKLNSNREDEQRKHVATGEPEKSLF